MAPLARAAAHHPEVAALRVAPRRAGLLALVLDAGEHRGQVLQHLRHDERLGDAVALAVEVGRVLAQQPEGPAEHGVVPAHVRRALATLGGDLLPAAEQQLHRRDLLLAQHRGAFPLRGHRADGHVPARHADEAAVLTVFPQRAVVDVGGGAERACSGAGRRSDGSLRRQRRGSERSVPAASSNAVAHGAPSGVTVRNSPSWLSDCSSTYRRLSFVLGELPNRPPPPPPAAAPAAAALMLASQYSRSGPTRSWREEGSSLSCWPPAAPQPPQQRVPPPRSSFFFANYT